MRGAGLIKFFKEGFQVSSKAFDKLKPGMTAAKEKKTFYNCMAEEKEAWPRWSADRKTSLPYRRPTSE